MTTRDLVVVLLTIAFFVALGMLLRGDFDQPPRSAGAVTW